VKGMEKRKGRIKGTEVIKETKKEEDTKNS
jgi:hypothetical protein